jgi:hypothetical protein
VGRLDFVIKRIRLSLPYSEVFSLPVAAEADWDSVALLRG